MRALIIEDERRLAENIAGSLREVCGFAVDTAFDGEQGLFLATGNPYDVIVLDLMLPVLSGPEMLQAFRAQDFKTPVLVLTAREDKSSIVKLLNAGADDYLAKPFDLGELIARLKALIRRNHGQVVSKLTLGDLEMDTVRVSVKRSGVDIALAPMEYRVLEYLLHRAGAVVSKSELSEHLYDYNWEKFSNVIEVYIAGLRRKVDGAKSQKLIHTVRGHGYVLRLGADM